MRVGVQFSMPATEPPPASASIFDGSVRWRRIVAGRLDGTVPQQGLRASRFQPMGPIACRLLVIFCGPASDRWDTQVYYTSPVGIGGADPVGDLFAAMTVTFGDPSDQNPETFGGRRSATAYFSQDLDLVDSRGVILGGDVTPEPATMSMMAFGLVGMAGMARRRRRKV